MNLATILFVSGLVFINVAMYYIFDTYIGLLTTGITLLVVGLIINHEQSTSPPERRKKNMGLFFNRGYPHNEEEAEFLLSTLTGFTGIGHHEYTYDQALANSDIFTAVMMIASDLAKMDILVKNDNVHDPTHPIEALQNKKPNNIYDGYTFKFIVFANALLTKHGYVEIVRDKKGQPVELYHLKTSQVELKQKNNRLYYLHKGEREI